MSKTYHREVETVDGEYGNYFVPHQNKDTKRARRLEDLAKKKRRYMGDDEGDHDS